jgi:hypothetical protein
MSDSLQTPSANSQRLCYFTAQAGFHRHNFETPEPRRNQHIEAEIRLRTAKMVVRLPVKHQKKTKDMLRRLKMPIRKITVFTITLIALTLLAAACNKSGGSSPTATAKAFYDAAKAKDVPGMKNALSKKSLEMMEAFAKMGGKTLDESLKEPNSKQPPTFEARNEKITGDTATLELKDDQGKWQTMPFVKEDGQWKIALDQLLEKAFQDAGPGPEIQSPGPEKATPSPEKSEGEQPKQEGEQPKSEGEHSTP